MKCTITSVIQEKKVGSWLHKFRALYYMPFYLYAVSNVEEPVKCPDRVTDSVLPLQYYQKEIPRKYNTNSI